jgi:phage-related protein
MDSEQLKPVRWVGSSLKDLKSFPPEVKAEVGHALYAAQHGATNPAAKPLKGFGGVSVTEIVAPFEGNTWRAVYTVRFRGFVLRTTRFPEKIQVGHRHPEEGHRPDSTTAGSRRTRLQRKAERT